MRATRLDLGDGEMVIFSYPVPGPTHAADLARLTAAERAVLALLLAGQTNAEVAVKRRRSARTVGKQIDAIYRKLGVHSRGELAARYG